ncbi:ShlB/FhaC/HecB family hemolysin secretion/activation protein [Sphingosinicella soli]|uniref:Hemolysin activation/secretion protein n=1 Tax=Sphingosinicella soli TaxID=333708 RepID=A0A7W7B2N8_9SPHN|nr:ShlB/FhaC/HecB family hemolysin secretion/activation protein [Sphingosinicella soli]MBB4632919.1 hemolysin activation/secretion protein [Sphingosinicella soli]
MRKPFPAATALAVMLCTTFAAEAQVTPADIPRTAEPRAQQTPDQTPQARAAAPTPTPLLRQQVAPEAAAETRFTFRTLAIDGASAISETELRALWRAAPGDEIPVSDIFAFADAVTRAYSASGYLLSFALVPEQAISDGAVRIQIIEGRVSAIRVKRNGKVREIRSAADAAGEPLAVRTAARILDSRPLKADALERALLLMNDLPGLAATSELAPSPDTPGASILTIDLSHRAVRADFSYTNMMSGVLGRDMLGGGLRFSGDSGEVRLRGWASPDGDRYRSFTGEASKWLGPNGLRVDGRAGFSWSRPIGELLEAIRYRGETLNVDLGIAVPIRRSRAHNISLTIAGHVIDSDSTILRTAFTRDRIRTASADLDLDWADASGGINVVRAGAVKGFSGLGATADDDPLRTRLNGSASFLNFALYAQRYQPIARIAGGDFSLVAKGSGQWAATDALLSAAECSYGGAGFGRSYDSGTVSADHCVMGALEARWRGAVAGKVGVGVHGFVDGGIGWQKGLLDTGEARRHSASSAGGGISVQIGPRLSALAEAAHGLSGATERKWRANFSISLSL